MSHNSIQQPSQESHLNHNHSQINPGNPATNAQTSASSLAPVSAASGAGAGAGTSQGNPSDPTSRPTTPGDITTDKLLASSPSTSTKQTHEPAAEAVLSFLRKRGLGTALLELQRHLDQNHKHTDKRSKTTPGSTSGTNSSTAPDSSSKALLGASGGVKSNADASDRGNQANNTSTSHNDVAGAETHDHVEDDITELERLEEQYKDQESALTLMTGGGAGYDLDAAPAILSWTNGPAPVSNNEEDAQATGNDNGNNSKIRIHNPDLHGNAQQLEDTPATSELGRSQQDEARRCIQAFTVLQTWVLSLPDDDQTLGFSLEGLKNRINCVDGTNATNGSVTTGIDGQNMNANASANAGGTAKTCANQVQTANFIPSSIKLELLSLTFPLLVHTYCDLLESNLEKSANTLLSSYRYIHEPRYPTEFRDLDKCNTSAGIAKLNEIVVLANEALGKAKTIRLSYDKRKTPPGTNSNPKVKEEIEILQKQYELVVKRHTTLLRQLRDYPFLKRVRSVKWQLNLSSLTFGYLARFLRSSDVLLPMSVLLQTRCQVLVESRDPSPFVPACILEDMVMPSTDIASVANGDGDGSKTPAPSNDHSGVRWAAPVPPSTRSNELGELESSILKEPSDLPFPIFNLEKEYNTVKDYENDRKRVEFNRALLSYGFRRLAALEVKDEYEIGMRRINDGGEKASLHDFGNPMEPSIMLSTLCSSLEDSRIKDPSSPLEESGIELTCAKLCPPDGRRVAAGCSDSAIRIWSMDSWSSLTGKGSVDSINGASTNDSVVVLVGHKKGLPVFDIDWNKDGRTLISAGGDGSLRLWDTKAVGSYGEIAHITDRKSGLNGNKGMLQFPGNPSTTVPGAKHESRAQRHGSALVCYQGHAPSTPVWSVAIAPCGYYFASAGADSTARLWCTDRPMPIRVFAGHYSENVNCVSFHPNCNYIMSGSDDKTVRMWDVQSGSCVRMLCGCTAGVNKVQVSPSGQFVAGADYRGIVHIWDLRNGRKLNEFKHHADPLSHGKKVNHPPIIQSMSFSPCGAAIATSTDDANIHIWNAQGFGNHSSNPEYAAYKRQGSSLRMSSGKPNGRPFKTFRTNRTSILDLQYTKRNLLLSVGKYFEQ